MKKIAIVTGASSGMGLEAVKQIIAKYTTLDEVWVLARRTDRLESLAASVRKCKVVCITADLTKECDREILFGRGCGYTVRLVRLTRDGTRVSPNHQTAREFPQHGHFKVLNER